MLSVYPACFFKEKNGYSVIFPDLNWLATCGETLNEALAMAIDCLAGYLYTNEKDGEIIPAPSAINDIDPTAVAGELGLDSSIEEMFVNMVSVDVAEYAKLHFEKSVKKTLTIPAWLNSIASEQNINFSQVLQDALKVKLNIK
ncbi:MAG: HicB family protein [Lachnospiraceae bacterium]|nr:HicB family protein [Lachnospiraceae bacterium]